MSDDDLSLESTVDPLTAAELAKAGLSLPLVADVIARDGLGCKVCGKAFQTKNALLDHTKVHWGKTQCGICGKVFSTQGNMKRHRAKVHNADPDAD